VSIIDGNNLVDIIEQQRLKVQQQLDSLKTQAERNKLGQFGTPTILATDILEYAKALLPASQRVRFLDPAFGTGAFYSALLRVFPSSRVAKSWGYEIDPHYGKEAIKLWANTPLTLNIADFTRATPPASNESKANLLICNPPYVRHHHLYTEEKSRLQCLVKQIVGIRLNGLSGLYCYFLLVSHEWMASGGLAGWLIPSEFMDVNYGKEIKQYLLEHVTLLRVHRFNPDEVQFGDALVSSAVVWFRKEKPSVEHQVEFSYGGPLAKPEKSERIPTSILRQEAKWTKFPRISTGPSGQEAAKLKLSDLFNVKRGIATGANKFFILTAEKTLKYRLPNEFLAPILPGPRYLTTNKIEADDNGNPILSPQLFLLACNLPENVVRTRYPSLWEYLQIGEQQGINKRYLCRHRSPWYSQEHRPPAPLLCTYMGRQTQGDRKPFRFILNHSKAIAPNVYLMLYPKHALAKELKDNPEQLETVWQALNEISQDILMSEGRTYGGGLHKIEPNELANAPAGSILDILPSLSNTVGKQLSLFDYAG